MKYKVKGTYKYFKESSNWYFGTDLYLGTDLCLNLCACFYIKIDCTDFLI